MSWTRNFEHIWVLESNVRKCWDKVNDYISWNPQKKQIRNKRGANGDRTNKASAAWELMLIFDLQIAGMFSC